MAPTCGRKALKLSMRRNPYKGTDEKASWNMVCSFAFLDFCLRAGLRSYLRVYEALSCLSRHTHMSIQYLVSGFIRSWEPRVCTNVGSGHLSNDPLHLPTTYCTSRYYAPSHATADGVVGAFTTTRQESTSMYSPVLHPAPVRT